jgi:periplasmic protein TonB
MSRDLFVSVTDASVKFGTRKWYTVPLAFAVHTAIVGVLIVAPLMAAGALPIPDNTPMYLPVVTPPLPAPPPIRIGKPATTPLVSRQAAPLVAPDDVQPEADFETATPNLPVDGSIGLGIADGVETAIAPPPVVAPPASRPVKTVRAGIGVRAPERLTYVGPVYPPLAQTARVQGLVILEATIDTGGRVRDVRVLRSDSPLLNDAALSAVRQWVYTPTLLNGVPVSVVLTVTVQFRLQ